MRSRRSLKVSHTQTSVPCGTLNITCGKIMDHEVVWPGDIYRVLQTSACSSHISDNRKLINYLITTNLTLNLTRMWMLLWLIHILKYILHTILSRDVFLSKKDLSQKPSCLWPDVYLRTTLLCYYANKNSF